MSLSYPLSPFHHLSSPFVTLFQFLSQRYHIFCYCVIIILPLVSIPPLPQPHSTYPTLLHPHATSLYIATPQPTPPHHPLHLSLSLSSNPPILRFYSTLHPHPTPLHTVTPQPTRPPTLISTLLHLSHPPPFHPHPKKQITNLSFQDFVFLSSPLPEKTRHFVNLFCGPPLAKNKAHFVSECCSPFRFPLFRRQRTAPFC